MLEIRLQYVFKDVFSAFSPGFFFPKNCGALSSEHSEHVHHDISAMGKRYQGKWSSSMLAGCCWIVTGDSPVLVYKWEVKKGRN
jgi:hypothetical protein